MSLTANIEHGLTSLQRAADGLRTAREVVTAGGDGPPLRAAADGLSEAAVGLLEARTGFLELGAVRLANHVTESAVAVAGWSGRWAAAADAAEGASRVSGTYADAIGKVNDAIGERYEALRTLLAIEDVERLANVKLIDGLEPVEDTARAFLLDSTGTAARMHDVQRLLRGRGEASADLVEAIVDSASTVAQHRAGAEFAELGRAPTAADVGHAAAAIDEMVGDVDGATTYLNTALAYAERAASAAG